MAGVPLAHARLQFFRCTKPRTHERKWALATCPPPKKKPASIAWCCARMQDSQTCVLTLKSDAHGGLRRVQLQ